MKTVLVLAHNLEVVEAIREGVNSENYRIIHRRGLEESEPLLNPALLHFCILDADSPNVQGMWTIEKLRQRIPQCPLIVYTGEEHWEWEEEAYLKGVSYILEKPIRPRLLNALLDRISVKPSTSIPRPPPPPSFSRPSEASQAASPSTPTAFQALEVLRHFSAILTHSLDAQAMLRKFLLLVREIVGVNRAAIFLREPAATFRGMPTGEETPRLHNACAIGLQPGLLEHFELSLEAGIGGHLFRSGRILRRYSEEVRQDLEMQQEFELLGAQVAIPILDRETLVGAAVFDGRVTGEPLVNAELELIFHLLEELGLAIKNIRLHDQLAANHEMMADIFRQLSSACVVVSRELVVLHANKTAHSYFGKQNRRNAELEFSDLPPALGTKVYQVLKTGTAIPTFQYKPDGKTDVYNVSVVPFQKQFSALPISALLMVEDVTQAEQLKKREAEANNLRLVTQVAERLAHEVGNALVPLSTHQQLLNERFEDPEFRTSLETAMDVGTKRVLRLVTQMRLLARHKLEKKELLIQPLVEEAYKEAQKHHLGIAPKISYELDSPTLAISGDPLALRSALAEILLNSLQVNTLDLRITVRTRVESNGNGHQDVQIEIQDNGPGFTLEARQKVPTAFYTTRTVGLGLGLTVARKVIEAHHGKLEFPNDRQGSKTRVTLPLAAIEAPRNLEAQF